MASLQEKNEQLRREIEQEELQFEHEKLKAKLALLKSRRSKGQRPQGQAPKGQRIQHKTFIPMMTIMVPAGMPIPALHAILSHHVAHGIVFSLKVLKQNEKSKIILLTLNLKMDYSPGTPQGNFVRGVKNAPEDKPFELHYVDLQGKERFFKIKVFERPHFVKHEEEPEEEEPKEEPEEEEPEEEPEEEESDEEPEEEEEQKPRRREEGFKWEEES